MIQEFFLKKALNIRREYLEITNNINTYENMVSGILKSLTKNSDELESLKKKIDDKKVTDIEFAKSEMLKIIMELEQEANKTGSHINKLNRDIDNLREQEIQLHKDIKERYPQLNDVEIKKEIQDYIKNLS
jgi:uncharacterized coiled-coil DUF342 family protein